MRGRRLVGLIVLIVVFAATGLYLVLRDGSLDIGLGTSGSHEPVSLRGYVGGEKLGFLRDPEVQQLLSKRYQIDIDAIKAGSIEMVSGDVSDVDFLWPSSQVALEIYEESGGPLAKDELVFNSPIVLYSWDIVADALQQQGIVTRANAGYYAVDLSALVRIVQEERTWEDLGVSQLYGKVKVVSTDPTKSNSGNQFAGLLANTLNGGEVVDQVTIDAYLPEIDSFFGSLGFLHSSSGDLFSQYLKQGVGAYPLVVGYESQIVEFSLENREALPLIQEKTRILYPQPTVWSSHPIIALDEPAERLIDALLDPDVQALAWSKHGFRTGLTGVTDDPTGLDVTGIPATIDQVMPMPAFTVMDDIIRTLGQ